MRKIIEHILLNNKISRVNISEKLITYIHNSDLHSINRNTAKTTFSPLNKPNPADYYNRLLKNYKSQRKDKLRIFLFLSLLFFCSMTSMILKANAMSKKDVQVGIAEEIIRFHVLANSDSNEDQELKITVKNTLVKTLSPILRDTTSKEEARAILSEHTAFIKDLAEKTIRQNGYNYSVTVSLENTYFPLKIYGDYTFPPGYYEALRVKIGKAEGKNWWCVMFPPLCFVDETYNIVDEESDDKLKNILNDEEYEALFSEQTPVKVKFKLWETIKDLFR